MAALSPNVRGILLMVAATGSFTINDSMLKLATQSLPPFEALFLRGVGASLWAIPLIFLTKATPRLKKLYDGRVLLRNMFELLAVMGFILGLANVQLADIAALSQLAPMILVLGAVFFFGEQVGRLQIALICFGFIGALLVAQPGGSAFSAFALFGFWNAFASAVRDLVGRRVGVDVPGVIVATGAALIVMVGAGLATLLFEQWHVPGWREIGLIAASALFLMGGHTCIFLSFRGSDAGAVAPFAYAGALWALLLGFLVFGALPNPLALTGIGLIVLCGIGVVLADEHRRRTIAKTPLPPGH